MVVVNAGIQHRHSNPSRQDRGWFRAVFNPQTTVNDGGTDPLHPPERVVVMPFHRAIQWR